MKLESHITIRITKKKHQLQLKFLFESFGLGESFFIHNSAITVAGRRLSVLLSWFPCYLKIRSTYLLIVSSVKYN